ncbi:MAG: efflux RND transporter periplasmic adaptor subunit [Candidatus Paceibacteria bacterium]
MGIIQAVIDSIIHFISVTLVSQVKLFFTSRWSLKKITILVGLVAAGAIVWFVSSTEDSPEVASLPPQVRVATVDTLKNQNTAQFIGTVRSVSEADLQTERGGRVTSVRVKAGDVIRAGTVIATLENASEQAAVLQAQGSYQAALAANRQGILGIAEATTALETAKRNAVTGNASAYNTVSGVVRTTVDSYFANPTSQLPGLRIDGKGSTQVINAARVALESTLAKWQSESTALTPAGNITAAIENGRRYTKEVVALVDSLITALERDTAGGSAGDLERAANITVLTTARGTLLGIESSLQGSLSAISAAEDAKARAEITAGSSGPTANSAAITQALGALRAAQANLEKTIIRSPISGTVAVLRVNAGEYIAAQTPVARVTGGTGLEISIFVGDRDREQFVIGNTVQIDGTATGTVVNIAPAIDPVTQKVEVKVATDAMNLVNGDTVSVTLNASTSTVATKLEVPITAIKFTDTAGFVFVVDNNLLRAVPVEIGEVNGSLVTIKSGIDSTTEFVVDARGKTDGEQVEVIRD